MDTLLSPTLRERFFARLRLDPSGCVVWTGGLDKYGYGRIKISGRKYEASAHHVSLFLKTGNWPTGIVRHSCDNRACVRLGHLTEGTHADNVADMVAKGRNAKGTQHGNSKLTDADVLEIRRLAAETPTTYVAIAQQFGVTDVTVGIICGGVGWKHLGHSTAVRPMRKVKRYAVESEMLSVPEMAVRAGVPTGAIYARIREGATGKQLVRARYAHV